LKDLNYNWNKQYNEIIHILEILVNNHWYEKIYYL
jgi:hypothetical protein